MPCSKALMPCSKETRLFQPCLSRSWTYKTTSGKIWVLLLEDGEWFRFNTEGIKQRIDTVWLQGSKYYYKDGRWEDLRSHKQFRMINAWEQFAITLLPCLNSNLESGEWSKKTIKPWSHYGCTRRYDDVGNRLMGLVIDMALELNRCVGVPPCPWVERLNMEHKADLLEAVMGLRTLYPGSQWTAWGDMVDEICTDVHEAWSSPELKDVWDLEVVAKELFARFGINVFFEWHLQSAKSTRLMQVHRALRLRLRGDLVNEICRFLGCR